MNDFFEHLGGDLQELAKKAKDFLAKLRGKSGANGSVVTSKTDRKSVV